MFDAITVWTFIFIALMIAFSLIIFKSKYRKLYLLYFIFGMIFGFCFDSLSVFLNYYTYAELYLNIIGVPITVTIAEGFAVVITIKIFEKIKDLLENHILV